MGESYSAKSITVLEGLEPVRKRPGMYIGGLDERGFHHLLWEIVDNAVDEAIEGHATQIQVTLHADGATATVTDNGRGIPVDAFKGARSALEVIMTTLHAGAKFDHATYRTAGGLHGVGASVVNALSARLVASIRRDGHLWQQTYTRGVPEGPVRKVDAARGTGSSIEFLPDPIIFGELRFDPGTIGARLEIISFLNKGTKVRFRDETSGTTRDFQHEGGLRDFLADLVTRQKLSPIAGFSDPFVLEKEEDFRLELSLVWTEAPEEHVRSFANGIPTRDGGSHEQGFKDGLAKAVRQYLAAKKVVPKGVDIVAEDIREGLAAVLSVFVKDPQFQGQTKDRLNNPEARADIERLVRPALEHFLLHHGTIGDAVAARVIQAARARHASRAAATQVRRKSATSHRLNLPGKLADCATTHSEESELFIVEGDSAGGSAKQGRNRDTQAILPLRGKVLNAEQATAQKVLENRELADIVKALGCGAGKDLDLDKLRYGKVILLMDADSDGNHIATLLLTFFYRHLRSLIDTDLVYIAKPPLYRIDAGKEKYFAQDDREKDRILRKLPKNVNPEIQRFKGLGEMNPLVLYETTMDPGRRQLELVTVPEGQQARTEQAVSELMGKNVEHRSRLISESRYSSVELDI